MSTFKKYEKKLGIVYLVVFIVSVIISVYIWWRTEAEVYAYKKRAQVASEAEDILNYLNLLKNGMERWKMTTGYYALIFKTPWNNAGLDYKAVCKTILRTERLTKMDKSSVEYQTGMDDVRGIIRELEMDVFYFWALHTPLLWGFFAQLIARWSWIVVFTYVIIRIVVQKTKEDKEWEAKFKN